MILEMDFPDQAALDACLASSIRPESHAATEAVMQMFDGRFLSSRQRSADPGLKRHAKAFTLVGCQACPDLRMATVLVATASSKMPIRREHRFLLPYRLAAAVGGDPLSSRRRPL